jgi:murein L,D-transpeptidase YcbB/YkuD
MTWRVAKSLLKLREQVNALAPDRSKSDDGTIGDERHQASVSDHNPDSHGIVRAMDLTHDPRHGFDSYKFAEMLRQQKDPRIKYVISNGRIWSSSVAPYQWRKYTGSNKHDRHVHISVVSDSRADSTADWKLAVPTPPVPVKPGTPDRFDQVLKRLLVHEGGNDDDPRDPGGRTSRGITQSEYNIWRQTHAGLPTDVWDAPNSTVKAIYKQKYWDPLRADELPPGVDYAVFDYGVNSGISKAAKALQEAVGSNPDGYIGPLTLQAVKQHAPEEIIKNITDERMNYLHHLPRWVTFGRGWTTRVTDVQRDAAADAGVIV